MTSTSTTSDEVSKSVDPERPRRTTRTRRTSAPAEPGWGRIPSWAAELATYSVAVVFTTIATAWALSLRAADLRVPFTYWGDALSTSAHVKTTLTTGWYEHQPLLGVPAGQTFHDFPTADNLHLVAVRILGLFTSDWPTVLNLYFLIGFPLAAMAAVYFLRQIGVGRTAAVVAATLFAVAPYHFTRGEAHLWLSSYYVIPLALLVVYRVFQGEPVWHRPPGSTEGRWTRPLVTGLSLALVGTAQTYYAVFIVILIAVSGVASLTQHRDLRRFVGAVVAGAWTVVVAFLNMLPDILWARQNGPDLGALVRNGAEAELYSLKLSALLLPVPNHVVDGLAKLRTDYDAQYPLISERPVLGAAGAIGLLILLVVIVVQLAGRGTRAGSRSNRWFALVTLGSLSLVALLFATVGGFSSLISLVTPDLRGWNRMSILISMLALGAVAVVIDMVAGWLRARTSLLVTWVALAVAGSLLVVAGAVDQIGTRPDPAYEATAAQFASDAQWVGEVETTLGADAWVFQLPYLSFPEAQGLNGILDTDQLKPFLHSDTLGWSGGGIKGRATADWGSLVSPLPPDQAAPQLAAAGFTGVVVDKLAYSSDADKIVADWSEIAGAPVVTSSDGRYVVFDLKPTRASLDATYTPESIDAVSYATTHPTMIYPGADVVIGQAPDGEQWNGEDGVVTTVVDNAADTTASVTIQLDVLSAQGPVTITAPWGTRTAQTGSAVRWTVDVPPGQSTIVLSAGPDAVLGITEPQIVPSTSPLDLLVAS